jgi:hypothetical protein
MIIPDWMEVQIVKVESIVGNKKIAPIFKICIYI